MKTTILTTLTLVAAGLAGLGGLAGAADAQAMPPQGFERALERADANRDGSVSLDEMKALKTAQFGRLDRNGDGRVDAAEIERARSRVKLVAGAVDSGLSSGIDRLDADRDGTVSLAEYEAETPFFTLLDVNADGILEPDEIERLRSVLTR